VYYFYVLLYAKYCMRVLLSTIFWGARSRTTARDAVNPTCTTITPCQCICIKLKFTSVCPDMIICLGDILCRRIQFRFGEQIIMFVVVLMNVLLFLCICVQGDVITMACTKREWVGWFNCRCHGTCGAMGSRGSPGILKSYL
jgi:hypothetical protein